MKREGWLLAVVLLTLTILVSLALLAPPPSPKPPCLGNNCVMLSRGGCTIIHFPYAPTCVPTSDQWGNQDECEHPPYFILGCTLKSTTLDVRLYQCTAPPPPGAVGLHWQWIEEREYNCGAKCRAEFVTKKPPSSGEE